MEMSVFVVQLLRLAWTAGTLHIIIVSIRTPKLNLLLGTLLAFASKVFGFLANPVTEFIVKGKDQIPAAEVEFWQAINPLIINLGWKHWIGAAVLFVGWFHQQRCHKILGLLRHSRQADEYVIPHGDWFEIVSSPHYLSEMVANLTFAAGETRSWCLVSSEI